MNVSKKNNFKDSRDTENAELEAIRNSYSTLEPIDFIIKREFANKYNFYDRHQSEDAEEVFERFAEARRLELNQMPKLAFDDLVERLKSEPWDLEEASVPFMGPHAKADFAEWSRCALWTVEETVALFLGRDPITFQWDEVQRRLPNSQWFREADRLKRHLEQSVDLKKIEIRQTPWAMIDWSIEHGFIFPRQLVELVFAHDKYDVLSPSVEKFWRELDARAVNSFIAIFATMAVDKYDFDPDLTHNHAGSKIAYAMGQLKPSSIGPKPAISSKTINSMIKTVFKVCKMSTNTTKYIQENKQAGPTSSGAQRARRRKAKSDKIGG